MHNQIVEQERNPQVLNKKCLNYIHTEEYYATNKSIYSVTVQLHIQMLKL